jgi:hypothetical protein
MHRYSLRTLLILMAIGPPMLAVAWAVGAKALVEYRQRQQPNPVLRRMDLALQNYSGDAIWLKLPDGRPAYMAGIPLRRQPDDSADE